MAIEITRVGRDLYKATLTPPHSNRREGTVSQPMTRDLLMRTLRDLGCRPTEISEAFYDADPDWLIRQ
jgi:hypothetical protein